MNKEDNNVKELFIKLSNLIINKSGGFVNTNPPDSIFI